jgi:hypothetical protein
LRFYAQARGEHDFHTDAGLDHMQAFAVEAGAHGTFPAEGQPCAADDAEIFRRRSPRQKDVVVRDYVLHLGLLLLPVRSAKSANGT